MGKKNSTYERIEAAAEKVFSHHGYEKATMDEIMKLADVGKGTIYNYFGNKEQLLYQLLTKKNMPLITNLENAVSKAQSLEEKLVAFFTVLIDFYRANAALWQIIFYEMSGAQNGCVITDRAGKINLRSRYDEPINNELKERILRYHELIASEYRILARIITYGIAREEIVSLPWPEVFVQHLFFGVCEEVFHHEPKEFGLTSAQSAQMIISYYLDGIRK